MFPLPASVGVFRRIDRCVKGA